MASEAQESTVVSPSNDDIIPDKAEIAKSPSHTQDKLWSFLKTLLQLLGVLQILIGLINTSLWTKWASWLTLETQRGGYYEIFTSGYALWGGLSFTISGIFSFISPKISSKVLVKCCLVTSILSSLAALAGMIIIYLNIIVNHECRRCPPNFTCYKNMVTLTGFVLGKLTLAAMELCISIFLIAFSAFQIKVPEEKLTSSPLENPYEDLLFQPVPYDEIQLEQGYEQCDP